MIKIRINNKKLVLRGQSKEFNLEDVLAVEKIIKYEPKDSVIINLEGISSIKNEVLDRLKQLAQTTNIFLCNIDANVFAVINLLKYDNVFHLFPNEESSILDRYEIKNRRFTVV